MDQFQLHLNCQWTDGQSAVTMTPLVIDLDGDSLPEIVFVAQADNRSNQLLAIRGDNCSLVWRHDYDVDDWGAIAAADLDGDGFPEIALIMRDTMKLGNPYVLAVLDHEGNIKATSDQHDPIDSAAGVAIGDVDGSHPREIVAGRAIYEYEAGNPVLQLVFKGPAESFDVLPTLADVDSDGRLDLVTGLHVFDGLTGLDKTPGAFKNLSPLGGYPGIADFNGDGKPDIAFVQPGIDRVVSVVDVHNDRLIFGPLADPTPEGAGGNGGPPTIDDVDGDGVPEIGVAGAKDYCMFSMKCAKSPRPKFCSSKMAGALWCAATQDLSSGWAAATTFDFNGDGLPEVIYRDECWLRIFEGWSGRTVFALPMTSLTAIEYPVIADLDADGHADLIATGGPPGKPCDKAPEASTGAEWTGPTKGVFVYSDSLKRWPSTRPLWTSHPYHVTDINDDATVPIHEQPSWLADNTFRRNRQGTGPLPDFTARSSTTLEGGSANCALSFTLVADICNRGRGVAPAGVPGTFYLTDPRQPMAQPICTGRTQSETGPGRCQAIECVWKQHSQASVVLWFRADDDGTTAPFMPECNPWNDLLYRPDVKCMEVH